MERESSRQVTVMVQVADAVHWEEGLGLCLGG